MYSVSHCIYLLDIMILLASAGGKESDAQVQGNQDLKKWQWYLSKTGVSMHVRSAWRAGYTGKGILVAVVDDGVNIDHPDLRSNINMTASYDFLEERPISRRHNPGSHGTKCAGIIAGGDNDKCGVGVAFDAQISTIRIYDDAIRSTDQSEAMALSFKRDMVDIYSNSWGPGDMGWHVVGPGPRLRQALVTGTRLGRQGKGSIFLFAAGNGGLAGDSCAFSGYVNNIHTIAISGVNWDGSVPAYSEPCAAIMAVTYGQDIFAYNNIQPPMITAKGDRDCTERFPGTSGTTAMASGIIALALQANQNLTWRDVQHLIVRSSRPLSPSHRYLNRRSTSTMPLWKYNNANLAVSPEYGFGLMDADRMVKYAKIWRSVPQQFSCEVHLNISSSSPLVIPNQRDLQFTLSLNEDTCSIQYLEHVKAEVNLQYTRRGYLEMFSTSPRGTKSKLLYSRTMDILTGIKTLSNWPVTSLHYWGENPIGNWSISIRNARRRWGNAWNQGHVFGFKLTLFGTRDDPLTGNSHVTRGKKQIEEVDIDRRKREFPIQGGYSQWGYWDWCSRSCGGGIQRRFRSCTNPRPANGGRDCSGLGAAREERRCNTRWCPVHGGYSDWGSWRQCTKPCGGGIQYRYRSCTRPRPQNGGRGCSGPHYESRECNTHTCWGRSNAREPTTEEMTLESNLPVDGGYSDWGSWRQCTKPCGGGIQYRYRSCTRPRPQNGGRGCSGHHYESRECSTHTCRDLPVDGGYSDWGSWRQCTKTCGGGIQYRYRSCTRPRAQNGGRNCRGPHYESRECNTHTCGVCRDIGSLSWCQKTKNDGNCNTLASLYCKLTCGYC